ncbi:MAG: L-histidine N(alpha)-methyltransferase [Hyphomicrobiales bacterium]|nr:L-histidine N(alpha)-methyltransferase [Hyphomicrobiales bacterium]
MVAAGARTALRYGPQLAETEFARDVLVGLSSRPKRLSPKYFYDERGARLFEAITCLPEYYPTRCELAILARHAPAMAELMPAGAVLIEFGSGSSRKVRRLLDAAPAIAAYVPVDISSKMLAQEADGLQRDYPRLTVLPVEADFTRPFRLPREVAMRPRFGFFPGSTIGNFEPQAAAAFLGHAAGMLGAGATFIVGFDLIKDRRVLHAAYNDAAGVTARFNLNLLARINRELYGDFDLDAFEHRAFYAPERRRIEMHLVSCRAQRVTVAGCSVDFGDGETIHTESSYKYSPQSFAAMAQGAGWMPVALWTDPDGYFAVQALSCKG